MGMPIFGPTVMSKINAKSSAPKFLNFWFLVYAQMIETILSQVIAYLKFKIFFLQKCFHFKKSFQVVAKKVFSIFENSKNIWSPRTPLIGSQKVLTKSFDPPAPPWLNHLNVSNVDTKRAQTHTKGGEKSNRRKNFDTASTKNQLSKTFNR